MAVMSSWDIIPNYRWPGQISIVSAELHFRPNPNRGQASASLSPASRIMQRSGATFGCRCYFLLADYRDSVWLLAEYYRSVCRVGKSPDRVVRRVRTGRATDSAR